MESMSKKSVLLVSPVILWPADRGNKRRIVGVMQGLVSAGYDVHLVQLVEHEPTLPLRLIEIKLESWCTSVTSVRHPRLAKDRLGKLQWKLHQKADRLRKRHFKTLNNCPKVLEDAVAQVLENNTIDLVWVNYVKLSGLLNKIPREIPVLCDTHDVQFIREKRLQAALGATWSAGKEYRAEEMQLLGEFPYLLAITETDRDYLAEEFGQERVFYMPLTVPTVDSPKSEGSGPILFVGAARKENEIALNWFLRTVFPLVRHVVPDARLRIVGGVARKFSMWEDYGVELVPYAPVLDPHFEEASLCIAPILAGGGVKVKIIESLAAKRAVVTTTIGAEGIPVDHGRSAWVADAPMDFAEGLCSLLTDTRLRRRIEKNGRSLFEANYSDGVCERQIQTIVSGILDDGCELDAAAPKYAEVAQ